MKVHLSKDPILKPIIEKIELPAIHKTNNLYLTLIESIVSQQLSVKVADIIFNRFLDLYEERKPTPEKVMNTDIQTLRSIGFSNAKANYVINVAQFDLEHGMDLDLIDNMSDEEIQQYLTQIKGVGKWTVEMLLIFALERPDVFPIDDLGIQQGMMMLYGLDNSNKKEFRANMLAIAEQWRPYRSYASRYVWRAKDSVKK